MTRRALQAASLAILLIIVSRVVGDQLTCYVCTGTLGEDAAQCISPTENTTRRLCEPGETFCKKKIIQASGQTLVERHCYDDLCTNQQGIAMGQRVYIDTFCCRGDLCNEAQHPRPFHHVHLLTLVSVLYGIICSLLYA